MPKPQFIPAPYQSHMEEVWDALVGFHFLNQYDGETRADILEMADAWATSILKAVGHQRLSSDRFWNLYRAAKARGLEVHDALGDAYNRTASPD